MSEKKNSNFSVTNVVILVVIIVLVGLAIATYEVYKVDKLNKRIEILTNSNRYLQIEVEECSE